MSLETWLAEISTECLRPGRMRKFFLFRKGNSHGWPRNKRKPEDSEKTVESLILWDHWRFLSFWIGSKRSPVRILVNNDLKSTLYPWLRFEQLPRLILPLHFGYQSAVVWLFQMALNIEGTAYTRVSHNRGKDVRAVDDLALPWALAKHVSFLCGLVLGKARQHWMPKKLEQVGIDPREGLL